MKQFEEIKIKTGRTRVSRQRKTADPCVGCGLHRDRCLCALIPHIELKTHLTLVIHAKELKRTTNTGRLALKALKNSNQITRGLSEKPGVPPRTTIPLLEGYRPLLFFPADDAVELTPEFVSTLRDPIQLIVPDGNWRQASKVRARHPELSNVTCIRISTPNLSNQHLRAEHSPEGMSTLEAIARAIGCLESREAETQLLQLYREKLERTLQGRGVRQITTGP